MAHGGPPGDRDGADGGLIAEPAPSLVTSRPADDSTGPGTAGLTMSMDGAPADGDGAARPRKMGRYTLLAELGSGGMGIVYKAWDPALDRAVALKVLLAGRLASQRHLSRFLDEARAIARLDHPALVEVYDIGLVDGCPYFTMEFVAGHDLERAAADAPLDPVRACRLLARVARGLAEAHRQGIVHRDLKPANILVDTDDTPRLIDFGVARFLESSDTRTRTGQVVGTPAYMAPEQAMGRVDQIGPATDIFGLGATLYRVVTGFRPGRLDLGSLDGAPRDVLAICVTAMAEAPTERYPSMAALADELERFARGEPVQAALPGLWRRTRWRLREARGVLLGAAGAALLAAVSWLAVDAWDAHTAAEDLRRREDAAASRLDDALDEGRRLRADGDSDGAARVEEAVILRPEVQETRALARFHLQRAADATARHDRTAARGAAASAFAAARHPAETSASLVALGEVFAAEYRIDALRAIVERLARDAAGRRAADPLRLALAMGERRFAEAARLAERAADPRAPVLAALMHAHATPWTMEKLGVRRYHSPAPGDVDGDGRPELFIGHTPLWVDAPTLPRAPLPPLEPGTFVTPLGDGLAALQDADGRRLARLADGGWQTLTSLAGFSHFALGDLDGDGAPRLFALGGWRMGALAPDSAGVWRATRTHPPSEAGRIVPRAADIGRFAARGPALVVAAGGWLGYDLRIYQAAGGADATDGADGAADTLHLAAREKLGGVVSGALVERPDADPLIAVVVRSMLPEPRMFPPEQPAGRPEGIHLFEWTAAGLEAVRRVPLDSGQDDEFALHAADLDGDGLAELIVSYRNGRRPARIFPALGRHPPIPLVGLNVLATARLDADPAAELVVHDTASDRLWTLGVGDDPLPARPAQPLRDPEDHSGPPAIHELARLGLVHEAIDAWRREIRLGRAPADAAWHAARLAAASDRVIDAAGLFMRAAEGRRTTEALRRAARAYEDALDWPGAQAASRRLVERPDAAPIDRDRLARLDARLTQRLDLKPGTDLPAQLRIIAPDRLRVDRAGGALEVIGDRVGPIARLPVIATGGPLAVEVAMQTPRLEYAGVVDIGLVARAPTGERRALFRIENVAWGGGSVTMQRAMLTRRGADQIVFFNRQAHTPTGDPLHVRVTLDPGDGRIEVAEYTTGQRWSDQLPADRLPRSDERLMLEIGSAAGDSPSGATVRARVETLLLDGLAIDREAPLTDPALHVAGRALAEGRPAVTLDRLGGRDDDAAAALRAAALYDLGRFDTADEIVGARLPDLVPGGPFDQMLRGRVRRDPLHFAPLVRAVLGPAADAWLQPAFAVHLDKHPLDPEVRLAARALLMGAGGETTAPEARMALLLARSADHRRAGRIGAARADLERYRALLESQPPPGADDQVTRGKQWSRYHRLRAESRAQAGDLPAAIAAVRDALATSPTPEIMADRLLASPALRPLHAQPVWTEVRRAAAWSDRPAGAR